MKREKLLLRIANTLAQRMTWERTKTEWSDALKAQMGFIKSCGLHVSRWYLNEETGCYRVMLDDLSTGEFVWSTYGD